MLIKDLTEAFQGGFIWRKISKKHPLPGRLFLVLPEKDPAYNDAALRYISVYAKDAGFSEISVVAADSGLLSTAHEIVPQPIETHLTSGSNIQKVLRFLTFHSDFLGFCTIKNVRVVSKTALRGYALAALAEKAVFSPEHLVWNRMLWEHHRISSDRPSL